MPTYDSPVPTWRSDDGQSVATLWDAGTIDAGSTSSVSTFTFWNNWAEGVDNVSKMTDVKLSIVDATSGSGRLTGVADNSQATVQAQFYNGTGWGYWNGGTWTSAYVSLGTGQGYTANTSVQVVDDQTAKEIIRGSTNDGSLANSKTNYAMIRLKLSVNANADAGELDWLTRVSYKYTNTEY